MFALNNPVTYCLKYALVVQTHDDIKDPFHLVRHIVIRKLGILFANVFQKKIKKAIYF